MSEERKKYLKKIRNQKITIFAVQIGIVLLLIAAWEILANIGVIDSFIMSSPSRILRTFLNLTQNDLWHHIQVTCIETMVGFLLGTILGTIIAVLLWWSKFLAKVMDPFLVVLNSLPKVALRTYHNHMGRSGNASHYCNGTSHFFSSNHLRNFKWIFKYR